MKIKTWLLALAFLATAGSVTAQYKDGEDQAPAKPTWNFSYGSMIYFFKQYLNGIPYNGLNTLAVLGARYNFKYLGKSTSLAVGSYPGLGLAFYSGFGGNNVYFSFDLPLMLELHTGADAHPNVQNSVLGFFMGAGMGINLLNKQFYLNNPPNGFSYGPTATTGIKINFSGRPLILRGAYLRNFNPNLPDLKAVGILWSMGSR